MSFPQQSSGSVTPPAQPSRDSGPKNDKGIGFDLAVGTAMGGIALAATFATLSVTLFKLLVIIAFGLVVTLLAWAIRRRHWALTATFTVLALGSLALLLVHVAGDRARFVNPGEGDTINLCPSINGVAPVPADGAKYYLIAKNLEINGAHYRLVARVANPTGEWKIPARTNIGSASNADNGWWELSLVLVDKYQSSEYERRFTEAQNTYNDSPKDLGDNLPPNSVKASIKVNRISSTCS